MQAFLMKVSKVNWYSSVGDKPLLQYDMVYQTTFSLYLVVIPLNSNIWLEIDIVYDICLWIETIRTDI